MFNIIKNNLQLFSGIIFLVYLLFTYSNALYINFNIQFAVLLIIPIYFMTIYEFIYFYNKKGKPRLQDWFRIMFFFMLVYNFMTIVNQVETKNSILFFGRNLSLDNSIFVMIVIIFSLFALDLGYIIHNTFKKKNDYNSNVTFFSISNKNLVFGILIITSFFELYLLLTGITGFGNKQGTSGIGSLLSAITTYLTPFGIILSAYIIYIENSINKTYKTIFYSMTLLNILIGLISGMKENTLQPILYIIIILLIAGRKIDKKYILGGIFFMIILYPINNEYRKIISDPFLNTKLNILNFGLAFNKVISKPLSETLSSGAESYSDRGDMYPFLLYVIDNEDKWDYYKYMDRYIYLPVAWFLPSAILSSKPKADIGGVLYEQLAGFRSNTAITATSIGWAYLEGGIIFVLIIFILLGVILEIVDSKNIRNPLVLLFYCIFLHKAIKPEWDPYFMINSIIPMIIIYTVLLKLIGVQRSLNEN